MDRETLPSVRRVFADLSRVVSQPSLVVVFYAIVARSSRSMLTMALLKLATEAVGIERSYRVVRVSKAAARNQSWWESGVVV